MKVEFLTGDFPDISLSMQESEQNRWDSFLHQQQPKALEALMERLRIKLLKNARSGTVTVAGLKDYRLLQLVKATLRTKLDSKNK